MTHAYSLGIVGTGSIAQKAHIPIWSDFDDVTLVGMADVDDDALEAAVGVAANCGVSEVTTYPDGASLIENEELDVIDVTVPAGSPKNDVVREALEAGCHVTVQKPFVDGLAAGITLIELADEHDRVLSVNQQARYAGAFATAKEMVADGKVGEVRSVRISSDFQFAGAGRWFRHGVHGIDLVRYWTGKEPTGVNAWHKRQTDDDRWLFATWLDFENELAAEIWDELSSSTTLRWAFRIAGTEGTIDGREAYFDAMEQPDVLLTKSGDTTGRRTEIREAYVPTAFERYFRKFIDSLDGAASLPCPAADNIETIRVALGSKRAAEAPGWVDPVDVE